MASAGKFLVALFRLGSERTVEPLRELIRVLNEHVSVLCVFAAVLIVSGLVLMKVSSTD